MFASPAKNNAQCTDVHSKTTQHLGRKRLQNKLVTTLEFHESNNHQITMLCINILQQKKKKNSQKYPNSMVLAVCDSYYHGIVMWSTVRHHIKKTHVYTCY